MIDRAKKMLRWIIDFLPLIQREKRSKVPVGLANRIRMWSRGFLGESYVLYGFHENFRTGYLTDYQRFVKTPRLNGRYAPILDNKIVFNEMLWSFKDHLPKVFGFIDVENRFIGLGDARDDHTSLRSLIETEKQLVVKPVEGGGGLDIHILKLDGGLLYSNGQETDLAEFQRGLRHLNYIVEEFVTQHGDLEKLFGRTINTIRIVTMNNYDGDGCFIAAAVLRIGTEKSYPVDNWGQGGLCSNIDLETGVLSKAVSIPAGRSELTWVASHPESGSQLEGIRIPHWHLIRQNIVAIGNKFKYLRYVGWDVVVTNDHFKILEGNRYSDVNLLQVHAPLLNDERVRRFYSANGVI